MTMNLRTAARALAATVVVATGVSCKDSSAPPTMGPPSQLVLVSSVGIGAFANTLVPGPVQISVQDAAGHPLPNQTVSFAVTDGGGVLDGSSGTSDANGTVTLPGWHLGKLAVPQKVQATLGSITKDISATVTTNYRIDVRFFGASMTPAQQALFANAAARISGIVTGDLQDAQASNQDLSICGITGQPPLNEIIDDVIIFASISPIDGSGKILARAGPCLTRQNNGLTAVGTMQFDSDDIATLTGGGSLQEVITHEMMHVLGYGVFWNTNTPPRALLDSITDRTNPRYLGTQARQGCVAVGGTVTCATNIPVEGPCPSGCDGTAFSHWRESTFDTELMTGFIDASPNPLSVMTIGSVADLGYVVNSAAADTYLIPGGQIRASNLLAADSRGPWEAPMPHGLYILENGKARLLKR